MSTGTTLLEVLQSVQTRLQEYPTHTLEFATGWFDAIEQTRTAIEISQQFSTLTEYPIWMRVSNRVFGQRDLIYFLAGVERIGQEYANGFTECCEHIATALNEKVAG